MTPRPSVLAASTLLALAIALTTASEARAQTIGAPVLNNNQPILNTGNTVTLAWTAPTFGTAIGYVIEAASVPGGAPDLVNYYTGNPATSLLVPGVPPGVYYVRVRAFDGASLGPRSNEVQVNVAVAACPSAPQALGIVTQNGSTVTIGWQPPASGTPASYVIQVGSGPGLADLVNLDTNSMALSLVAANVPIGTYFVRVYARGAGCAPPALLSPASNELVVAVGTTPPGWAGPIVCTLAISGPNGYHHNETQTWLVGGPGVTTGPRTNYPVQWSAQGSGGGATGTWSINATSTTDFSVTIVASTGIPLFDRTSGGIIIRGGIVGSPTSFDLHEIEFPGFTASSATATSVSGTFSRPTDGGDSPQQPGGSTGTLTCNWSLNFR